MACRIHVLWKGCGWYAGGMNAIVSIQQLDKTYDSGFQALKNINLDVREGEILALLGPNGAGKTSLISIICGIVRATGGTVSVAGFDNVLEFRKTRDLIGLVPQELTVGAWDIVRESVAFSRGLYGRPPAPELVDSILRDLSLYDKRDQMVQRLSGGMKRRLLIAKALVHEPRVLFLDEPTAGVDVELRKDMWGLVGRLRDQGVTIILTTHYIEEAEAMADRVGVISKGELLLVEDKDTLMAKLGKKTVSVELFEAIDEVPAALEPYHLSLSEDGVHLSYQFDIQREDDHCEFALTDMLRHLSETGLAVRDIAVSQSSLEDIFVDLVKEDRP